MNALFAVVFLLGCGSRPPIDPTVASQGAGFYCYKHPPSGGHSCFRALEECESASAGADGTPCEPEPHAYCYSLGGGTKTTLHCFGAEKRCNSDAVARLERGGVQVSRCEEL